MWGMQKTSIKESLLKIKAAEFDGVELGLIQYPNKQEVKDSLKETGLDLFANIWTNGQSIDEHANSAVEQFQLNLEINPILQITHIGKDYFCDADNLKIIDAVEDAAKKAGVPVCHETHRGRFLYSANSCKQAFEKKPNLKINADFSHWCVVSESFLEGQEKALELGIKNAIHIHARVGFPEGPQITDPRAPEWETALNIHINWWAKIIENNKTNGTKILGITPEFGPPPYMPIQPFTRQPISDLWEINLHMKNLLKEKFKDI